MKTLFAILLLATAAGAQTASDFKLNELQNVERAKAGLPALAWNQDLFLAAQEKAQEQVDHSAACPSCPPCPPHDMCSGERWDHRVQRYYQCQAAVIGENSATTFADPQWSIDGWMASPGHRDNILSPFYTEAGCALRGPVHGVSNWYEGVCTFGNCHFTPPSRTPIPTATPRPSKTPRPTRTPRQTRTPRPTRTPTPSRTSGHR